MAAAENTLSLPRTKGKKRKKFFSGPPTAKVGTGVFAGALTTLLLPYLRTKLNLESPESLIALTSVLTFVVQYIVPEQK